MMSLRVTARLIGRFTRLFALPWHTVSRGIEISCLSAIKRRLLCWDGGVFLGGGRVGKVCSDLIKHYRIKGTAGVVVGRKSFDTPCVSACHCFICVG